LVAFRDRLIEHDMDRQLIERTVQVANQSKEMRSRQLRGMLDSSPLWGTGRVEDTYNLIGHALHRVLGILARQQGRELEAVAGEAGADLLAGPSLKAALDAD
jgi:transposase